MKAEVQVLREMKAYTRPQIIDLDKVIEMSATGEIDNYFYGYKLYPGWDGGTEEVTLAVRRMAPVKPYWYIYSAELFIDNLSFGDKPGLVYNEPTDIPSGYVHFIAPGPPENPLYGHTYTLMMRTVEA